MKLYVCKVVPPSSLPLFLPLSCIRTLPSQCVIPHHPSQTPIPCAHLVPPGLVLARTFIILFDQTCFFVSPYILGRRRFEYLLCPYLPTLVSVVYSTLTCILSFRGFLPTFLAFSLFGRSLMDGKLRHFVVYYTSLSRSLIHRRL